MSNDIYHGVIIGLVGPFLARLVSRFKYRLIFLVTVVGLYLAAFVSLVWVDGWHIGFELFIRRSFKPTLILAALGIGLLAVVVVFLSSLGSTDKKE